jgi:hypothetical protein
MLDYLPFVPIAHGMRVGVAIVSYNARWPSALPGPTTRPLTSRFAHIIEGAVDER